MDTPVQIVVDHSNNLFGIFAQLSTIVLAVIAIIISIITYRSQITHNKNSVRPILNISCSDYEDNISVKIKNKGTGPGTVLSINCIRTDYEVSYSENSLINYFNGFHFMWTTFTGDISGYTIAPNNEMILLEANSPNVYQLQEIRKHLKDIEVIVEYENIYNEKMKPAIRKLDWFGRNLDV